MPRFPKSFKIFAYGSGRKKSAVIVSNIVAVPIKQVSDENDTLIEISCKSLNFKGTSLYRTFNLKVDRLLSREYFTPDAIYNGSAGMTYYMCKLARLAGEETTGLDHPYQSTVSAGF